MNVYIYTHIVVFRFVALALAGVGLLDPYTVANPVLGIGGGGPLAHYGGCPTTRGRILTSTNSAQGQ